MTERQTLLDQLPNNLNIAPIVNPVNSDDNEHKIIIKETKVGNRSANNPELLNLNLPMIKQKLSEPDFNFTRYKKELWREKFKLDESISYGLALLIPDIYRSPLTELGYRENPHLALFLWGPPGQNRTTIGRLLSEQWLYSLNLSETGFDSDVGVLYALSKANKNILVIGSDIGTAVKGMKDWQRKLPAMVVNFIWDAYDSRVTKGEGMLEAKNQGDSFYGGGNRPLGRSEFTVKDVSRIIQKQISTKKDREIALLVKAFKGTTKLNELAHPFILYTHYLNALIMKGRVRTGIFDGRKVKIVLSERLKKKIAGHIFRHYLPRLTQGKSDDEIWNEMESYEEQYREVDLDINAILRIRTMAYILSLDSAVDDLLLRPYRVEGNAIEVYAIEEDLTPLYAIMDRKFWDMKRFEFKQLKAYPKITPIQYVPEDFFYQILKETKQPMSIATLWTIAKEKIVEEDRLMTEEVFYDIYSPSTSLAESSKLRTIIEKLENKDNIVKTGGGRRRVIKFQYLEEQ